MKVSEFVEEVKCDCCEVAAPLDTKLEFAFAELRSKEKGAPKENGEVDE